MHVQEFIFSKGQHRSIYNNWEYCFLSPHLLEKVTKIVPKFKLFEV